MSHVLTPKYPAEIFLEFRSIDRFLYRVSDLHELKDYVDEGLLDRLDQCHVYLLGKRPRLTVVPETVEATDVIRCAVEYKSGGVAHQAEIEIPRSMFSSDENNV